MYHKVTQRGPSNYIFIIVIARFNLVFTNFILENHEFIEPEQLDAAPADTLFAK